MQLKISVRQGLLLKSMLQVLDEKLGGLLPKRVS